MVDASAKHIKKMSSRPALTGDVTFLDGEVTELGHTDPRGPVARVEVLMTNQKGEILAKGPAEVLLPGI